ncbi:MAG: hypothetical protein R6U78_07890, partial [Bacteroidales bacterium]
NWLAQFPGKEDLLTLYPYGESEFPLKVNNHIHSPYSFSAFRSLEESVRMADEEDVRVLGINDFYVTDGYEQFIATCRKYGVFPLLNIELIGISRQEQKNGIRVNDPNNPGRTYISGKGLAFPVDLPEQQREKLDRVVEESNRQVEEMIDLLNQWLIKKGVDISLSVDEIMQKHAFRLLRERHVAKALRVKLEEQAENEKELNQLISRTVGGDPSGFPVSNVAALEDELRARLLKSGGPAYVPEDERAFLSLEEILKLIRDAGGIPTYPLLLDGAKGHITEFENDPERLRKILEDRAIHAVEFIPLRNSFEKLKEYSEYFYGHGFTVSFGTEHNTTSMKPLTVFCKGNIPLDGELMRISYNGVATIAAHQYLTARGEKSGKPESRKEMEQLGHAVIQHYLKIFLPSPPAGAI